MNQKRNKIILAIALAIVAVFSYVILYRGTTSRLPTGNIEGFVYGQSFDVTVPNGFFLSQVNLSLIDKSNPQKVFHATTDAHGSFTFAHLPLNRIYVLKVNTNDSDNPIVSYYLPYQREFNPREFKASSGKRLLSVYLNLNKKALRDVRRQQSLYLYKSLLEDYRKDHGHYPINKEGEAIRDSKAKLISVLSPYLKTKEKSKDLLVDPLKLRPFVYGSIDGTDYWINAYPEIVTEVPLFNARKNRYVIHGISSQ